MFYVARMQRIQCHAMRIRWHWRQRERAEIGGFSPDSGLEA
jgi:hypothetical protein